MTDNRGGAFTETLAHWTYNTFNHCDILEGGLKKKMKKVEEGVFDRWENLTVAHSAVSISVFILSC